MLFQKQHGPIYPTNFSSKLACIYEDSLKFLCKEPGVYFHIKKSKPDEGLINFRPCQYIKLFNYVRPKQYNFDSITESNTIEESIAAIGNSQSTNSQPKKRILLFLPFMGNLLNQIFGRIIFNSAEVTAMYLCNCLNITFEELSEKFLRKLPDHLNLDEF